ncbi:MAG: FG-GAP repeat protein [Phycisphaerales bacterium]|nr:FG-GAP repeat protein [Phycisphaerales bacterium]
MLFHFKVFATIGFMSFFHLLARADLPVAPALAEVVAEANLKASNADNNDQFGFAVSVSGDTMVGWRAL